MGGDARDEPPGVLSGVMIETRQNMVPMTILVGSSETLEEFLSVYSVVKDPEYPVCFLHSMNNHILTEEWKTRFENFISKQ